MGSREDPTVRRAHVAADHPRRAAGALASALGRPGTERWPDGGPSLVVVFASWRLDPAEIAATLQAELPGVAVIGCTSYGEIAEGGDLEGSAVAMAIGSPRLRVGLGLAPDLARSALRSSRAAVVDAAACLGLQPEALQPSRHVGIALVDGRSGYEESFCLGSAATAPQIRFVGGSASDGLEAEPRARVFFDGAAHAGAGVVAILETDLPFAVIESEHMVPTDSRVVVTSADPEQRRVHELDGMPAVARYAQLVAEHGAPRLTAEIASSFPFALYIGGRPYVRSVAEILDGSLLFATAVDPGAVLRLMRSGDLVGSTRQALVAATAEVGGELRAVIAFSCLGRHREALTSGSRGALAELYHQAPLVGFHSFGEQKGPLLVNHTLTGLALGPHRG